MMLFIRIFLYTFLMYGFLLPVYAKENSNITIRIFSDPIVYKDTYTLGDIAEFDGSNIKVITKLSKVILGKSPLVGKKILIKKNILLSKINPKLKDVGLYFFIPKGAVVTRASLEVSKHQIINILEKEIKKQYVKAYPNFELKINTSIRNVLIPKGKFSYSLEKMGNSNRIGGSITWELSFYSNEKKVKKLYINTKIIIKDNMIVAKKFIRKGTPIQEEFLTYIMKDVSKNIKQQKLNKDSLVGKITRKDILQGEMIQTHLVELPTLIREGKEIFLIYKTQNMELQTKAKALQSGREGEIISVKNSSSKKIIRATIIDSNHVQVL